jgi:hypothetical protein
MRAFMALDELKAVGFDVTMDDANDRIILTKSRWETYECEDEHGKF